MRPLLALALHGPLVLIDGFALTPVSTLVRRCSFFEGHVCSSNAAPRRSKASILRMGLFDGLVASADDAIRAANVKLLLGYENRAKAINSLEPEIESLTDEELRGRTDQLRARARAGEGSDALLNEAFAVVREAAWRVLELRHYDVQLMGGMALHEGRLAEMATGEGKTLVATLPAYLNAVTSSNGGVFVVTANDYLARRDAESMGQVLRFLGLEVGLVQADMDSDARRAAYACDVTYVTNQELGFDLLRDHQAATAAQVVQVKPLFYAIVDEADSILIDEARTPLIISRRVAAPTKKYATANKIANVLQASVHYNVREKEQAVVLTDKGFADVDRALGKSMFDVTDPWAPFVLNALKAKELYRKDKEYVVANSEVQIVDAFSGRVLGGRRFADGLHQAIEAKEDIPVGTQSQVTAQITYQSLFRGFQKLTGMTGTAMTDAREFQTVYGLPVIAIPTALPKARRDYPDVVFRSKAASVRAMLAEVERVNKAGRPVLIGTTSVEASEEVTRQLAERNITAQVLNARPELVQRESETVAQAGRRGVVTVATNMAGRGTDILLGGNAAMMARLYVRDALAPLLLTAEENAKQSSAAEGFYPDTPEGPLAETALSAVENAKTTCVSEFEAQKMTRDALEELLAVAAGAGPVEEGDKGTLAAREAVAAVRKAFAVVSEKEREEVLELGGLYVIGTSRHESRRVDNQLRGRSGRQGDPGATRFFLSLDDDIFRLFGGDKTRRILETFRLSEDMPIENKQVSETLDKVQRATEDYFATIRRTVLEFDEVLNEQRAKTYQERQTALFADETQLWPLMSELCRRTVDDILPNYVKIASVDAAGLSAKIRQFFPSAPDEDVEQAKLAAVGLAQLRPHLHAAVEKGLQIKREQLDVVRPGLAMETARFLLLTQTDEAWCTHLERMNLLKETVALEAYRGRNPLDEFRIQGTERYRGLMDGVRRNALYSFFVYEPRAK